MLTHSCVIPHATQPQIKKPVRLLWPVRQATVSHPSTAHLRGYELVGVLVTAAHPVQSVLQDLRAAMHRTCIHISATSNRSSCLSCLQIVLLNQTDAYAGPVRSHAQDAVQTSVQLEIGAHAPPASKLNRCLCFSCYKANRCLCCAIDTMYGSYSTASVQLGVQLWHDSRCASQQPISAPSRWAAQRLTPGACSSNGRPCHTHRRAHAYSTSHHAFGHKSSMQLCMSGSHYSAHSLEHA